MADVKPQTTAGSNEGLKRAALAIEALDLACGQMNWADCQKAASAAIAGFLSKPFRVTGVEVSWYPKPDLIGGPPTPEDQSGEHDITKRLP